MAETRQAGQACRRGRDTTSGDHDVGRSFVLIARTFFRLSKLAQPQHWRACASVPCPGSFVAHVVLNPGVAYR